MAYRPQEQMRQPTNGPTKTGEGKDSAQVQRLEQQIAEMAAELAKLGELTKNISSACEILAESRYVWLHMMSLCA